MYVLDTNAAYYLGETTRTTAQQLARLHEKAEAKQLRVGVPPITVLERVTHRRGPRLVRSHQDERQGGDRPPARELARSRTTDARDHRGREPRPSVPRTLAPDSRRDRQGAPRRALQRGFDDYVTATRRSADVVRLATYREDYERQYVKDMLALVQSINPRYDEQVLKGKDAKLPASEQKALRAFFGTNEWTAIFVAMSRRAAGPGLFQRTPGSSAWL